jgi:hypothetical protein
MRTETHYKINDGKNQTVTIGAASAACANGFDPQTHVVRLTASVDCFIKLGPTGVVAANTDTFLPAGQTEYFSVNPGQKVAVIQSTAGGTLYITEMTQ